MLKRTLSHGEFGVYGCFTALSPAEPQLGSDTKFYQKATKKRYWSKKVLGYCGKLQRIKASKFRSDASFTRHNSSQQSPKPFEILLMSSALQVELLQHWEGKSVIGDFSSIIHGSYDSVWLCFQRHTIKNSFWKWMTQQENIFIIHLLHDWWSGFHWFPFPVQDQNANQSHQG